MLALSSICGIVAFFVGISNSLSSRRKRILVSMELSAMVLLFSDRLAYLYRGNTSVTGFWMVRVTNFLVFFMTLLIVFVFNLYLSNLLVEEGGMKEVPFRIRYVGLVVFAGELLVIASQFTGFYYTFDEFNRYQRADGFLICYIIPILILLVQISVIIQYRKLFSKKLFLSIVLFTILPILASSAQIFLYGLSLTNTTLVGMSVVVYVLAASDKNDTVDRVHKREIESLNEEKQGLKRLFEQVSCALMGEVEKKEGLKVGHSKRVADLSVEIAKRAGLKEKECEEIYIAALLHDAGKMGIPEAIIGKKSELTDEENDIYKQYPINGREILSGVTEAPFISQCASCLRERYDGKGYPEKLKGEHIPEAARIIAVADAYDALMSGSNFREPVPEPIIRENFRKDAGIVFDPEFTDVMIQIIDSSDTSVAKERITDGDTQYETEFDFGEYRNLISKGIAVTGKPTTIEFESRPYEGFNPEFCVPTVIFFDSFDGRVHQSEKSIIRTRYTEYGEIRFDRHNICSEARNILVEDADAENDPFFAAYPDGKNGTLYRLEAAKYRDHVRIKLDDGINRSVVTVALPDSSRYAYVALAGEHCRVTDAKITVSEETIGPDEIRRIVDEISYIDRIEGDIPNVQIDGPRTNTSAGFPVKDGLRLVFHTMSLPTASLIWHCPAILLYSSDDGTVTGTGYREYALIRLDGESDSDTAGEDDNLEVSKTDAFTDWDAWKEFNRKGYGVTVYVRKSFGNVVIMTENGGIKIRATTYVGNRKDIYIALTGDQVALSNIMAV